MNNSIFTKTKNVNLLATSLLKMLCWSTSKQSAPEAYAAINPKLWTEKKPTLNYGSNLARQARHGKQTTQIMARVWVFLKNLTEAKPQTSL